MRTWRKEKEGRGRDATRELLWGRDDVVEALERSRSDGRDRLTHRSLEYSVDSQLRELSSDLSVKVKRMEERGGEMVSSRFDDVLTNEREREKSSTHSLVKILRMLDILGVVLDYTRWKRAQVSNEGVDIDFLTHAEKSVGMRVSGARRTNRSTEREEGRASQLLYIVGEIERV